MFRTRRTARVGFVRLIIYAYLPLVILGWFAKEERCEVRKMHQGFMNYLQWNPVAKKKGA